MTAFISKSRLYDRLILLILQGILVIDSFDGMNSGNKSTIISGLSDFKKAILIVIIRQEQDFNQF
ncbi:MAG: hypothetical protein JWP81_449 [Ferruginibacter sp.]|nr:hypothetical protein [Ferruginibacter sp.]